MSTQETIGCLYLHGFLSSPESGKAQEVARYYARHLCSEQLSIPVLPFAPVEAITLAAAELTRLQSRYPQVYIIGSSLGGFYATWLAQTHKVRAVVVNPAVRPHELFRHYIGPNRHYYTGEVHDLTTDHLDQLAAIAVSEIQQPQNLLLMAQTGDQTLDYRHALALYQNCPQLIEEGGSHTFDGFIEHMPTILAFAATGQHQGG